MRQVHLMSFEIRNTTPPHFKSSLDWTKFKFGCGWGMIISCRYQAGIESFQVIKKEILPTGLPEISRSPKRNMQNTSPVSRAGPLQSKVKTYSFDGGNWYFIIRPTKCLNCSRYPCFWNSQSLSWQIC